MESPPWTPKGASLSPKQVLLLNTLITPLLHAISSIANSLRHSTSSSSSPAPSLALNPFGDTQLHADILAEQLLRSTLAACPVVAAASSEEDPVERVVHPGGQYAVAFDPLDGSSIVGANWSVGTIVGIWEGGSALGRVPDGEGGQVAAVMGVYGPRTTAIIALREPGQKGLCFTISLTSTPSTDTALATATEIHFGEEVELKGGGGGGGGGGKYFAPANLRAAAEDDKYAALVARYMARRYTLRYSGGLVPDIAHALAKGHGVYLSPVAEGAKAKLRRLYELLPVALVVECAGGRALDAESVMAGRGERVLSRAVGGCDERGGIFCGNADEVDAIEEIYEKE